MLAVQNQLFLKMPWKSMFPIWMHMEEVPLIRGDSKLIGGFLILKLASFPVCTLFPLFKHRVTHYKMYVSMSPSSGAMPFRVVLAYQLLTPLPPLQSC